MDLTVQEIPVIKGFDALEHLTISIINENELRTKDLSRFGELGVFVKDGKIQFNPCLLRKDEFLVEGKTFEYISLSSEAKEISLGAGSLAFTYCQVPVVYQLGSESHLEVVDKNQQSTSFEGLTLDEATSKKIFERTEDIVQINVRVKETELR